MVKGSVQRKLRPMLLYVHLSKALNKEMDRQTFKFYFLKGPVHHLHKNPFSGPVLAQLLLQANITVPHKSVSADSNRRRK